MMRKHGRESLLVVGRCYRQSMIISSLSSSSSVVFIRDIRIARRYSFEMYHGYQSCNFSTDRSSDIASRSSDKVKEVLVYTGSMIDKYDLGLLKCKLGCM